MIKMNKLEQLVEKNGQANGTILGCDGNALSLVCHTMNLLKQSKRWSKEDVKAFMDIALSSNYDNVIQSCIIVLDMEEE
jgi:hypothetical protein